MSDATATFDGDSERASLRTWIAVSGCVLGAFMAVLDIQIVNSSLPEIEGGIGTGADNGTWISTAYLIGEIIMIPLTDYLSRVFGFRRFLLTNIVLFLVFSAACAFASNLSTMIATRAMQGFTGGVMIPMAFTILLTKLPVGQRPIGLAAFAITATFGPAIGPTIGGYLTEHYGWPYIFFINLIPGSLMLALLFPTLDREPMQLHLLKEGDWYGIGAMAIGLACFQTVLDEGNKDDWFGSPFIVHLSVIAAIMLTAFVIIELKVKAPAVRLALLANRNFGLGTLANVLVGFALFGSVYVLPTYLDLVQGYNAEQIGLVLAWSGVPQLFIIPFVPLILRHFDVRAVVCAGLVVFAASCFMNTHLSFNDAGPQFIAANLVRALGQAFLIAPLSSIAMANVAPKDSAAASGLFNMMRSLGGAIGTAALATIITKREQFHSNIIGQSVTAFSPTDQSFLIRMQHYFLTRGVPDLGRSYHQGEILLGNLVARQAYIFGFSDAFYVMAVVLLTAAVAVILTKAVPTPGTGAHA